MKVDTMRTIDRYIGIPLCFIISSFFKLKETLFRPKAKKPKKVLFIELSEMGSAILVDPAMRWLKAQGCELYFVIFKDNATSLNLLNTIPPENIYTIRPNNLATLTIDVLKFLLWCRRKNLDTVIDLELFSRITSILSRTSGAVNRIGFDSVHEEGLYRGKYLTHPVMYNPHIHISKNFMILVKASLSTGGQPYQRIRINEADISLARAEVTKESQQEVINKIRALHPDYNPGKQRLMLVNPNASDLLPQRRWMTDRFAEVIAKVLADYADILVIITGTSAEREAAEKLRTLVDHEHCYNSAGLFLFRELVPLYSLSSLMLSNDSGPPHFASVTALPTFVIFGPETPKLYGSLGNSTHIYAGLACSPCVSAGNHRKTSCTDNQCLKAIYPADILKAIKPTLDRLITKTS
ncbi:MAG: glycosyltransferase family 9 protein [Candidatus Endonucleobacter bathymodioli]|uniref:Glycosyltransferase family 9 protein n=1 Tax=Candidatus Endonucleibacter bathymodioli TaxID=539814 RepID=A0AA90NLX6_9GAMM|nr:glycosyltransferase family 9 protein [Candidatus Endonucleobacter bathymodioli]